MLGLSSLPSADGFSGWNSNPRGPPHLPIMAQSEPELPSPPIEPVMSVKLHGTDVTSHHGSWSGSARINPSTPVSLPHQPWFQHSSFKHLSTPSCPSLTLLTARGRYSLIEWTSTGEVTWPSLACQDSGTTLNLRLEESRRPPTLSRTIRKKRDRVQTAKTTSPRAIG